MTEQDIVKSYEEYQDYYDFMKEQAEEYQDFLVEQLRKHDPGFILSVYGSRKYQYKRGESTNGVEIKFDRRVHETQRLYIEIAEKADPAKENKVPSGIYRKDNSIFWLIGDYQQAFLFSKKQLQYIWECKSNYWRSVLRPVEGDNSDAYLLPVEVALRSPLCLYRFEFANKDPLIYDIGELK